MSNTLNHLQVNIGDEAAEKFLDQVLATATICRQHPANKIPMKTIDPKAMEGVQKCHELLHLHQTIQVS